MLILILQEVLSSLTMIAPFRLSQIKKAKKKDQQKKHSCFHFGLKPLNLILQIFSPEGGVGHNIPHNVAKQEIVFIWIFSNLEFLSKLR